MPIYLLSDEHPELFPTLSIMIYHNPTHHRVTIPVSAFKKITEKPNIVGMKDSHRTPLQFVELCSITRGKMSVFVNQTQMFPYYQLGAAGCYVSAEGFMGHVPPEPVARVVDTTAAGDSFNAGYLAGRLLGRPPEEAARLGNRLAARVIAYPGAIVPRAATADVQA